MAVIVALVTCVSWSVLASAFQTGAVTLHVGGQTGQKVPVVLRFDELPYGVLGVLLLYVAFAGSVARLMIRPAYHVIRTGIPRLDLPRIPGNNMQAISTLHLRLMLVVAGTGAVLVGLQYVLLSVR